MTPEQELEELYQRAQDDLAHAIEQTEPEGTQTEYEGRLLFHITMILAGLYISTERWTFANMAGIYWTAQGGAHQDMLQQHQASGQAPPPFDGAPMPLDTDAVSLISRNLNADLTNTIDHVGRVLQDEVRQAGVGATLRKASAAETVRQTKQNLLRMLQDRGIPAIEYMRAGERCFMQLKSYSALVARSTIREATNTASINYSMKIGSDLVKISTHFGACPVCVPYEGRVYSISGDNPHYPSLYSTPFSRQYKTFHPNCSHTVSPWLEHLHTPEEIEEARRYSNRSFDVGGEGWTDTETRAAKRSLEAYEYGQQKKRQMYEDRKQYFRYQAVVGTDIMPKSFAVFRRMKYNNSETYRYWQLDYRRRNQLFQHPELALPNATSAVAADEKFTGYLFNKGNADGWAKGKAFNSRLGYSLKNWGELQQDILTRASRYPAELSGTTPQGRDKYVQNMVLYGLRSKPANVRVVWAAEDATRMVTAMIEEIR